jgi:hypothetical protein
MIKKSQKLSPFKTYYIISLGPKEVEEFTRGKRIKNLNTPKKEEEEI